MSKNGHGHATGRLVTSIFFGINHSAGSRPLGSLVTGSALCNIACALLFFWESMKKTFLSPEAGIEKAPLPCYTTQSGEGQRLNHEGGEGEEEGDSHRFSAKNSPESPFQPPPTPSIVARVDVPRVQSHESPLSLYLYMFL